MESALLIRGVEGLQIEAPLNHAAACDALDFDSLIRRMENELDESIGVADVDILDRLVEKEGREGREGSLSGRRVSYL